MVALLLVEYGQQKQSVRRWPFLRLDNNNLIQVYSFVKKVSYIKYQQIPAVPSPPPATAGHLPGLSVPGVRHLQIFRCTGAGLLLTPGPPRAFDTNEVSYQNINTKGTLLEKQADWRICQGRETIEEGCKGMWLILCMHFFIAF